MKTKVNEIPTNKLLTLMYRVESLIDAETKPFNEFLKEFQKLKRAYKAGLTRKK